LLGIDVAGRPGELLGAALVLIATVGYAIAPIIVSRRLADLDPLGPVAASLTLAATALLPAALAQWPLAVPSPAALLSSAVLGIVCTAWGLVVFFDLIAEAGPNRASVITYVNPLVSVAVGVLVLGERLGAMPLVGLLLILGGSWLSGWHHRTRRKTVPVTVQKDTTFGSRTRSGRDYRYKSDSGKRPHS
jgi:drug/metabolite transporter (DMT)-like permease